MTMSSWKCSSLEFSIKFSFIYSPYWHRRFAMNNSWFEKTIAPKFQKLVRLYCIWITRSQLWFSSLESSQPGWAGCGSLASPLQLLLPGKWRAGAGADWTSCRPTLSPGRGRLSQGRSVVIHYLILSLAARLFNYLTAAIWNLQPWIWPH